VTGVAQAPWGSCRCALSPFRCSFRVNTVPPRQTIQALLTMLYRSTHRLSRTGASVYYLSHNSSIQSWLYITPLHWGTKQRVVHSPESCFTIVSESSSPSFSTPAPALANISSEFVPSILIPPVSVLPISRYTSFAASVVKLTVYCPPEIAPPARF